MIEARAISKQFKLYDKPSDRLRELLFRRTYHHSFQALDNISLQVASGETCGILGKNGAGKSTLLKILTGVLLPDSGEIIINGKITGLLELGTGFDLELSGLQNITINGLLLGMSPAEIKAQQVAIIEFSELGGFIKEPLRTYSSGMVMRLAFSIAIHAHPKCFVIDEALSVGDAHFQQKCMKRIRRFRADGGSIIFVSHDLNAVKMLCDRVLVLDGGRIVAEGTAEHAVNHYNQIIASLDEESEKSSREKNDYGTLQVEILSADIKGENSRSNIVSAGELTQISVKLKAHQVLADVTVGIVIRDRFGQDIFGTNSHHLNVSLSLAGGEEVTANFTIVMAIAPGKYSLTAALHSEENHLDNCYHWHDNLAGFEVAGVLGEGFGGVCRLSTKLSFQS